MEDCDGEGAEWLKLDSDHSVEGLRSIYSALRTDGRMDHAEALCETLRRVMVPALVVAPQEFNDWFDRLVSQVNK